MKNRNRRRRKKKKNHKKKMMIMMMTTTMTTTIQASKFVRAFSPNQQVIVTQPPRSAGL
jgi:hypothetical protein